jgi:phosphonate transport system substrate-binding protein
MIRGLLICLLALFSGLVRGESFIIGVHPIHSMRTLAERFEPLRGHLEAQLGKPVYVESAVDFSEYYARTLRGEFDLAIIPAHFARLAQKDKGFQPLIQFRPDNDALLVSHVDRSPLPLEKMKGQRLAVIDPLAVTVLAIQAHLDSLGLEAGRDYAVMAYSNHASVVKAVAEGLAMAGVTTTHGLKQVPEALRSRIRTEARITDIPSFVGLARPGLPAAEARKLKDMLLAFAAAKAGQDFLKGIAFTGFVPVDEKQLKRVDAYLKETRKGLGQ